MNESENAGPVAFSKSKESSPLLSGPSFAKNCARLSLNLQSYFDSAVSSRLMYATERAQYDQLVESGAIKLGVLGKSPCDFYGGIVCISMSSLQYHRY